MYKPIKKHTAIIVRIFNGVAHDAPQLMKDNAPKLAATSMQVHVSVTSMKAIVSARVSLVMVIAPYRML